VRSRVRDEQAITFHYARLAIAAVAQPQRKVIGIAPQRMGAHPRALRSMAFVSQRRL
jgi:hypothetical protein